MAILKGIYNASIGTPLAGSMQTEQIGTPERRLQSKSGLAATLPADGLAHQRPLPVHDVVSDWKRDEKLERRKARRSGEAPPGALDFTMTKDGKTNSRFYNDAMKTGKVGEVRVGQSPVSHSSLEKMLPRPEVAGSEA